MSEVSRSGISSRGQAARRLSALTEGEALLEMMTLLRYDALGLGNHEFDYGSKSFQRLLSGRRRRGVNCNNGW